MNELILYVSIERNLESMFWVKNTSSKNMNIIYVKFSDTVYILYRKCLFNIRIQKHALEELLLYSGC